METFMTVEGLAGHLKIPERTIRHWVRNREIPFYKINRGIRFRLSGIEKWAGGGGEAISFGGKPEGDFPS